MSSPHRINQRLLAILLGIIGCMVAVWLYPNATLAQNTSGHSTTGSLACVQPPANLAAWWPLDGNGNDIIGSNNGTFNDSPTVVAGAVGNALSFDGVNDYVVVPSSAAINAGTGDFSVAAWIKTTTTGLQVFIDKRSSVPVGYEFLVYNGRLSVQLADPTDYSIYHSPAAAPLINDGQWHYVAMSVDRDNAQGLKLYTDGQVSATFDPRGRSGSLSSDANLLIGGHALGSGSHFAGSVDEVDFYSRALAASEVAAIYQAGSAGKCRVDSPTAVPTNTPTAVPSNTPIVPTNTSTAVPSNTPIVPTNTPAATATPVVIPSPTATPGPAQDFRDVGNVRVWANSFTAVNGTTASGNVVVGPKSAASNGRYFKVSGPVSWTSSGALNLSGQVGFVNGTLRGTAGTSLLGQGSFSVDRTTGVVTWNPGAQVLYKTLGGSSLTISPTLTINVLQLEVQGNALVVLALPEQQELRTTAQFKLGPQGVISGGASTTLQLKLAGGTLVGGFRADENGLVADQVQYTLPGLGAITLQDLVIDGKGLTKFRFGAATRFPMPNLDLGNGVFVLSQLQATLGVTYTSANTVEYFIGLQGKLKLTNLPQNGQVEVNTFNVYISDGTVAGEIEDLNLQVAGRTMSLKKAAFKQKVFFARDANDRISRLPSYRYELSAKDTTWDLPAAWTGPLAAKVELKDVVLQTEAPYIQIGSAGASFTSTKAFYLGGDENAAGRVRFDQLSGAFKYNVTQKTWAVELECRITFTFGQDSAEVSGVKLNIDNGNVTGSISNVTLKVAGLNLTASTLAYQNNIFSAAQVSLKLPASWGNNSIAVTGLEISKQGVKLGGASGSFAIPDQTLGDVVQLSGMTASISIDAQRNYAISIAATVKINKVTSSGGGNSVSISGSLTIKNGRVDGTISQFSFKLVGVEFAVSQARFVDNRITAEMVSLKLPSTLGGAATTIYGLEIGGGDGFRIQGGTFRLPDFTMGGVGVQNVQAEINRQADGTYSIAAGAKLNLQTFSVEGRFRIAYNPVNSSVSLKHVYLSFEGTIPTTAIPLGSTGFFLTKIWGQFDMDEGSLQLSFGVRAAMAFQVGGKPLVGIDGAVAIKVRPSFEFRTSAQASLLGYQIASVDMRITRTSFALNAELHAGIIHAALEIAFGKDAANEFTFYGRASIELKIPRGTFVNTRFLKIPRNDHSLGRVMVDAGKFYHNNNKVWGGRLSSSIFGFNYYIFAKFSPGLGIDVGTRMSAYQPIRPVLKNADPALVASGNALYEINVSNQTTQLTFAEAAPIGTALPASALLITGPNNVQFVQTLAFIEDDRQQRVYTVAISDPAKAVGTWTVVTQEANEIAVLGAIPAPAISTFSACTTGGQCLAPAAANAPALTINQGQALAIAWQTSHVTSGLDLEIYATSYEGTRYPIAEQRSATTTLNGSKQWAPVLANGTYTLTLVLNDRISGVSTAHKAPLTIIDTSAPSAPSNLTATARADGSVALAWSAVTVEADVIGYRIAVNGQEPQIVEQRLTTYDLFGLAPGSTNQITLAAYDLNDQVGPASTVSVTIPTIGVSATWPARDSNQTLVNEVGLTFNQAVTVDTFTVSRGGTAVAGSVTMLTTQRSTSESVVIGAKFVPGQNFLGLGTYTATVRGHMAGTGEAFEVSWPFTVVEPANRIFMPAMRR